MPSPQSNTPQNYIRLNPSTRAGVWDKTVPGSNAFSINTITNAMDMAPTSPAKHLALVLKLKKLKAKNNIKTKKYEYNPYRTTRTK